MNLRVNGVQALANVDYGQGSGFLNVADSTRVEVEAIIPGANAVVLDRQLALDFSTDYTVLAVGEVADPIDTLVLSAPTARAIAAGNLRAQVVHAAPNAPAVDVYVTAPTAALASSTPVNIGALAFGQYTASAELPAGDYRIRVTAAGNPGAVVYDSGTLALAAGADLLIAAIENTGPGVTPVQLVSLDGLGSALILDSSTPASVVAVHASPDAPAVDLLADVVGTPTDEALGLARNVSFPRVCRIAAVPAPGSYSISVTSAGNPGVVALQFPLQVEKGQRTHGRRHGVSRQHARAAADRPGFADAQHRHGGAPARDARVARDRQRGPLSTAGRCGFRRRQRSFPAVPFGADTGVMSIAPGAYDVYVTPAGTNRWWPSRYRTSR